MPPHKTTLSFIASGLCICKTPGCQIPFGECHCGCKQKTKIAERTHHSINEIKGYPHEYVWKHNLVTHGYTIGGAKSFRTFTIWQGIKQRCLNPNNHAYPDYGGRGIKICERWMRFLNFLSDMGERPSSIHSVDRIDYDGNYEPGNCKWATHEEQGRNKRTNHRVEWEGKSITLKELSILSGIPNTTLLLRLRKGATPEQAVNLPKFGRITRGRSRWDKK